jgi:hypothetical protein
MTFELEPQDREVIVDVLEHVLSDLSMEIADTDRLAFRQDLKRRRGAISRALQAMRDTTAEARSRE